nr:uncharacterized protein LOC131780017 [Pocillopora verrucosa]
MWKKLPTDRRKDWKDKAQSLREDLDIGIAEIKKCPTCSTQFTREKDFKYHQKGYQQTNLHTHKVLYGCMASYQLSEPMEESISSGTCTSCYCSNQILNHYKCCVRL